MKDLWENMDLKDTSNFISCLAHICIHNHSVFVKHDFEEVSLLFYNCLKHLDFENYYEIVQHIIDVLQTQNFFLLNTYKIFVANKSYIILILLSSLRYCDNIFNRKSNSVTPKSFKGIVKLILKSYFVNIQYVPILRLLDNILKQHKNLIEYELGLEILIFTQQLSLFPVETFKYYSQSISKHVLSSSSNNECDSFFVDLKLLPLAGIETSELIYYFKKRIKIELFTKEVSYKVLDMFSNNIENREGGFLYKTLLFENFNEWRYLVWENFSSEIAEIDFEGEFIQSILKYWIPITVNMYKLQFYNHIYNVPVPIYIKGQVLLTLRRKQFCDTYNCQMIANLNALIMNQRNRALGLHILSLFQKRTICPKEIELQLIKMFLYSQDKELENEDFKSIYRFISHLSVNIADLRNMKGVSGTIKELVLIYDTFLDSVLNFGYNLLKFGRAEFGAQILNIFWKLSQGQTNLCYKVDGPVLFSVNMDNYIQYHKIYDLIEDLLIQSNFNNLEVTNFACYISNQLKFDNNYLIEYITKHFNIISIKTSESVKNVARIVTSRNNRELNLELYHKLHNEIKKLLLEKFNDGSAELENIFEGVLLFDAILEAMKSKIQIDSHYFNEFEELYIPAVELILKYSDLGKIKTELQSNEKGKQNVINNKMKKIVEAFLNNVLQYITETLSHLDMKKILVFLINIIESSNMRRPTTSSAQVLILAAGKCYNDHIKNDDFLNFKILLLNDVLFKLLHIPLVQHLTIRRNPESRLVIHALCVSDKTPQKTMLNWVIRELLKILSSQTKNSTLSSSLHCIETLISDNTMYMDTFEFVPKVVLECVNLFDNKSWTVRNANIQLAKALIDRFHGVLVGYNSRPKSVEDLFNIFPNLAALFYRTLSKNPLTDSAIIVMQFFSESQVKKRVFENEFSVAIREGFFKLFTKIIKENSNCYGTFAVRAYVSISSEEIIPLIICDVVDYILSNMDVIRQKHTISNFMFLLNELYHKYKIYASTLCKQPGDVYLIQKAFNALSIYMQKFDSKQLDLLLVKVLSVNDALHTFKIQNIDISEWEQRLWQHNYLPYIFINCDEYQIPMLLETICSRTIFDCIQIKILEVLLNRYCKNNFSSSTIRDILQCLIRRMFKIEDTKHYLLLCYFKIIFCFLCSDNQLDQSFLIYFRQLYGLFHNIYKIFVVVLMLKPNELENDERLFIKEAVKSLHNLNINNSDIAKVVSKMLPYFYRNVCSDNDKIVIFKIAVFLIMEYDRWDFVTFISKSSIPTALFAMIKIFDFSTLSKHFHNFSLVLNFVAELYDFINRKSNDIKNSIDLTYYVEERSCYVDHSSINKIILQFLVNYNRNKSNVKCFKCYKTVIEDNKK